MAHADKSASAVPPLNRAQIVDAYFMEHRARLLDVASFLDRVDRAGGAAGAPAATDDFRMVAYRRAIALLSDGKPDRARRILELLSDPSTDPIPKAGMKGAAGAHDPCT